MRRVRTRGWRRDSEYQQTSSTSRTVRMEVRFEFQQGAPRNPIGYRIMQNPRMPRMPTRERSETSRICIAPRSELIPGSQYKQALRPDAPARCGGIWLLNAAGARVCHTRTNTRIRAKSHGKQNLSHGQWVIHCGGQLWVKYPGSVGRSQICWINLDKLSRHSPECSRPGVGFSNHRISYNHH